MEVPDALELRMENLPASAVESVNSSNLSYQLDQELIKDYKFIP